MNVEKDDDSDQEEAICSHEVAGHVVDLQKTNVEDCRHRSECYQEQSDHCRGVGNPFQCFHSFRIYDLKLNSYLADTSLLLLCHLSQNIHHSSLKPIQCELRLVPGAAC